MLNAFKNMARTQISKVLNGILSHTISRAAEQAHSPVVFLCYHPFSLLIMGRYQSGQMERSVKPLALAFVGSNPTLPTRKEIHFTAKDT